MSFFIVSSKATKYKENLKKHLEDDRKDNSQRNIIQVFSNGFVPFIFSLLYIWECGCGERPIDFNRYYHANMYAIAVLGTMSLISIT